MKRIKALLEGKGEDGNVLSFEPVLKTDPKPPGGPDWLRSLKINDRFLARKKNQPRQVYLELFGIGHITDQAVLIAAESEYGPAMQMKYVNSSNFSQMYDLVEVLPQFIPLEEGEVERKEDG